MLHRHSSLAVCAFLFACASPDARREAETPTSLPMLRVTLRKPIADVERFSVDEDYGVERDGEHPPTPPDEEPWPSDEQAVAATRSWITQHFGRLEEGISLRAVNVKQSASGGDRPRYAWDRGHTIVLELEYRGLPTDLRSVVYMVGRDEISGTFELADLAPHGSAARILTRREAATQLVNVMRSLPPEQLSEGALDVDTVEGWLRLRYARSVFEKSWVLAPCWAVGDGPSMYVDAYSGQVRRNG